MMRRALIALVAALVLAEPASAFDWPWSHEKSAAPMPPRPVVSTVIKENARQIQSIPGTIAARVQTSLGFQTLGRITMRRVDVGSVVKKDELLAALDRKDLIANVSAAEAAVETARVQLSTAETTSQRTRALAQRNVATTAQLEEAERALASAKASLDKSTSELVRARDALNFSDLRAPYDGVISAVYANAGAVVSAGVPVLDLSSEEGIEAQIDLPDSLAMRVAIGDRYLVWSQNEPETQIPATVSQIEPMSDAQTRTRRIHLILPNDTPMRIGALVRAAVQTDHINPIMIPASAVLDRDHQPKVWAVIREGGTATVSLRTITLARPTDGSVVEVAEGIAFGDEIVIRGINSLKDGQAVGRSAAP